MIHIRFLKQILLLIILFIIFDFIISIVFKHGLNKYYGFYDNPKILINGSSMAMSGFNRGEIENLTGIQVAAYNHEGVSVTDRYAMINHFFQMYPESVRTVIYEVNPVLFSNIESSENVYTHFYPYMDDKPIDRYIKGKASFKDYIIHKMIRTERFDSRLIRIVILGYLNKYENIKTNTMDTTAQLSIVAKKGEKEVIIDNMRLRDFENTMDLIESHNADIVLVMMPIYYIKLQTFNDQGYENLCRYFKDYCSSKENIKFLDLNESNIIRNASFYSDQLHLNLYGQQKVTRLICSYLIEN